MSDDDQLFDRNIAELRRDKTILAMRVSREHMLHLAARLDRAEHSVATLRQQLAEARNKTIEECAACIPSTWLDPLLSGRNKIAEFPNCPDVERLLNATRDRISALKEQARDMTADECREMERQTRELDAEIDAVLNADNESQ